MKNRYYNKLLTYVRNSKLSSSGHIILKRVHTWIIFLWLFTKRRLSNYESRSNALKGLRCTYILLKIWIFEFLIKTNIIPIVRKCRLEKKIQNRLFGKRLALNVLILVNKLVGFSLKGQRIAYDGFTEFSFRSSRAELLTISLKAQ